MQKTFDDLIESLELIFEDAQPDIFLDEETGEEFYYELDDELNEQKIVIRVNAKGQKRRLLRCGPGRVVKIVNGRRVCVTQQGRARIQKKLAIRKGNRTKKAKGAGYKRRTNFKRQRARTKRRQMGLR